MEIGIVGAGKAGCSIGKYLGEHGVPVAGYFSRSKESVESAATFTDTKAFHSLGELVAAVGIIFIATPDDVIRDVWREIKNYSIQGKIIGHFSGSLSSAVFSGREQAGAAGCSVHPMYAFSSKFTSYEKLDQVPFTAEGDKKAVLAVESVFRQAGNPVTVIQPENKVRYHAAASMVSNMMVGLYQMSVDMLVSCGFDEVAAREIVEPLVRENMENVLQKSPVEALTGPIERNDICTVKRHLYVLGKEEKTVYVTLGRILAGLAGQKNPDQDYTALLEILREEGS